MANRLEPGVQAVNLGCGTSVAPGWINLDNSPGARLSKHPQLRWLLWKAKVITDNHYNVPWPENVILHDLRRPLPFAPASVRYVYASHVLEHLSLPDAQRLLRNIHRVLQSGGLLRLVVPDLRFGIRRYFAELEANPSDATAAPNLLAWLQLSKPGNRDPHLWMYDENSLAAELTAAGFGTVTGCSYRQGRVADCEILDRRPEDSLHMEAEKMAG